MYDELLRKIKDLEDRLEAADTIGQTSPIFLTTPLTSSSWDGDAHSTEAKTKIDLSAVFGAPANIKAVSVRVLARDSASAASSASSASTVALGLASALSQDRKLRVLLLELDLRRPSLDEQLGLRPPAIGVRQYLAGSSEIPVVRLARPQGFWLLSAGSEAGVIGPDLSSPRLAPLLRAADRVFDYVVADCPPLLAGGGGASLQGALDGFVLVVRSRRAARETIRRAAYTLRPELLVGLVLNAQRDLLFRGRPAHRR